MVMIGQSFSTALRLLLLMTFLLGGIYPLASTAFLQGLFPAQSNGSLLKNSEGIVIGSTLIGKEFKEPQYFWGRPSSTGGVPYNGIASGGSNLSPANPDLFIAIKGRVEALRQVDPDNKALIPIDLVTASGSGLDPHISVESALYQKNRIARLRNLSPNIVQSLIDKATSPRTLGILGEPSVNVLILNNLLDEQR